MVSSSKKDDVDAMTNQRGEKNLIKVSSVKDLAILPWMSDAGYETDESPDINGKLVHF